MVDPPSPARQSTRSYIDDWNFLFPDDGSVLKRLKEQGTHGHLQGCRHRSTCWRLLLQCIPPDKSGWISNINAARVQYSDLKQKYAIDPRGKDRYKDLTVNNPLSLANENPWQQYFVDCELRTYIRQDVDRTFPELEYFQSQSVREVMINVLFVYARQNPHVAYKQGMHEILGPLLFVLYSDQQAFAHACEFQEFGESESQMKMLLSQMLDPSFLEHDSFHLLAQIMRIIQPWYYSPDSRVTIDASGDTELFIRPQDSGPTNVLVRKLNWIGDTLLQSADPELYRHLETMEIAPQIYGIRWLRLLFGREFPIQDLLCLWDAIFSDGTPFVLVDHIFVAMLVFIRELLLCCDYTGCLHYLMRYPPVADVHALLKLSLHFRHPQKYPRPSTQLSMQSQNFSHITVSGRPHPNMLNKHTVGHPARVGGRALVGGNPSLFPVSIPPDIGRKIESGGKMLGKTIQKIGREAEIQAKSLNMAVQGASGGDTAFHGNSSLSPNLTGGANNVGDRQGGGLAGFRGLRSSQRQTSRSVQNSPARGRKVKTGGTSRRESVVSIEDMELLKEQVCCLQVRLNDVESTTHFAADKIGSVAISLRDQLQEHGLTDDSLAFQHISELDQVAILLRGSLRLPMDLPASAPSPDSTGSASVDNHNPNPDCSDLLVTNGPVEIGRDLAACTSSQSISSRGDDLQYPHHSSNAADHHGVGSSDGPFASRRPALVPKVTNSTLGVGNGRKTNLSENRGGDSDHGGIVDGVVKLTIDTYSPGGGLDSKSYDILSPGAESDYGIFNYNRSSVNLPVLGMENELKEL